MARRTEKQKLNREVERVMREEQQAYEEGLYEIYFGALDDFDDDLYRDYESYNEDEDEDYDYDCYDPYYATYYDPYMDFMFDEYPEYDDSDCEDE